MQECENQFKEVFETKANIPKTRKALQEQMKIFETFYYKFCDRNNDIWSVLDDSINKIENEIGYTVKCYHCASSGAVSRRWQLYDLKRSEYLYKDCNHKQHLNRKE